MKLLFFITILFLSSIFTTDLFAQGTGTAPATGNTFKITRPATGYGIDISNGTGDPTGNLGFILQNVIILFFTVGGLGFTIMIFWGAVDWILSGGDKEKVAGGRKRITTAITGLVVLSLSFLFMVIAGQVLSIDALQFGKFQIPGLGAGP